MSLLAVLAAAALAADPPGTAPVQPPAVGAPDVLRISFTVAEQEPVDHDDNEPGEGERAELRVGYTHANTRKKLKLYWDEEEGPDGVRLSVRELKATFRLTPRIAVSSFYREGSCPYQAVLDHEQQHIDAFLAIFRAGEQELRDRLAGLGLPTSASPALVGPEETVKEAKDRLGAPAAAVVLEVAEALKKKMEADRTERDQAERYQREVYSLCERWEWAYVR